MGTGASRTVSSTPNAQSTTNNATINNTENEETTINNNNNNNSNHTTQISITKSSSAPKMKVIRPIKRKSAQEIQKKLRKRKAKGQIWSNTYCQWTLLEVNGNIPPGRYAHVTVPIERNLFVFGGYTGFYDDSLYILNLDTNEWQKGITQGQTPIGRAFHGAAAVNDVIYVFGGYNSGGLTSNDLHTLDTVTMTWSLIASNRHSPAARSEHSLVSEGDYLYLFAGSSVGFYANDIHIYDTVSSMWATTRDINEPSKRCAHSCCMKDGKMIVYGGFDGKHRLKDTNVFVKSAIKWEKKDIHFHTGNRAAHASAFMGNKMYVFGGWDGQKRLNDVGVLDTTTGEWSRPHVKGNPPPGLSYHTATSVDNKIYVVGGWTGKERVNEVFVLEEVLPTLADLCIAAIVKNPEAIGDLGVLPADLLDVLERNVVN